MTELEKTCEGVAPSQKEPFRLLYLKFLGPGISWAARTPVHLQSSTPERMQCGRSECLLRFDRVEALPVQSYRLKERYGPDRCIEAGD
jgi:hypothetical protein